ncbi:hypothetical protein DRQ29_06870 [bacterium]|nr:MAG: hypothetical protein DRQ29_06870 [bacterium]
MTEKNEKIYFNSSGVLITESKALLSGKSYMVEHLNSVSLAKSVKKVREASILSGIGILVLIIGLITSASIVSILGLAFVALGIFNFGWAYLKPIYYIKLITDDGTVVAYSSEDKELVQKIIDALNQVILDKVNVPTE